MKALIVSETEETIKDFSKYLLTLGYDSIGYRWLMKALDNVEEISPQLVIINAMDYPRHWKTFIQFLSGTTEDNTPQIILVSTEEFAENELRKSKFLGVKGILTGIKTDEEKAKLCSLLGVNDNSASLLQKEPENKSINNEENNKAKDTAITSKDIDELRKTINELASTVLKQKTIIEQDKEKNQKPLISETPKPVQKQIILPQNTIETQPSVNIQREIPKVEIKEERKLLKFMFSNPNTETIVLGKILSYTNDNFEYEPFDSSILSQLKKNEIISNCTLKTDKGIKNVSVKIISISNTINFQIQK